MSAFKKVAGLVAGVSAVAAVGVAVAQGQPPNPFITNPALGAGGQTVHLTPIGETGVLAEVGEVQQTATLTKEAETASVAPAPAQPVAAAPAPAPAENVAAAPAPAPAPETTAMGAGPEPAHPARSDRG
jgi:hypothetical protein